MFLSRRYRPNLWPMLVLVIIEFCLTVALLALTGIAAPNLYRTRLWQDGANNGFNSSPSAGLYAAANYRPYTTPKVWSQLYVNTRCLCEGGDVLTVLSITNYNLVMSVLSMFIMLVKGIMWMLHVLPPIISAIMHAILIVLFTISVVYQASPDTSDPRHPQTGPPWYITKSCSVTYSKSNVGYCMQAKATFAGFTAMLIVFWIIFLLSAWSCIPSKEQKAAYEEKRRQKKLRWAHLDEPDPRPRTADTGLRVPETPGYQLGMSPVTPRTLAFNTLGGSKELPLRATEATAPVTHSTTFSLRSPGILRTPMTLGSPRAEEKYEPVVSERSLSPDPGAGMYFPPPPRESERKGKR